MFMTLKLFEVYCKDRKLYWLPVSGEIHKPKEYML